MGLYNMLFGLMKRYSIPVAKSFFKAYKQSTSKSGKGPGAEGKQHPFDKYFGSFLSKTNLAAPPLTQTTALRILNIEQSFQEVEANIILQRYYILFKKNDPNTGGTAYLQSKVFAAKECLMAKFQNAQELEQQFYKEVVEPQLQKEQKQGQDNNEQPIQKDKKKIEEEQNESTKK